MERKEGRKERLCWVGNEAMVPETLLPSKAVEQMWSAMILLLSQQEESIHLSYLKKSRMCVCPESIKVPTHSDSLHARAIISKIEICKTRRQRRPNKSSCRRLSTSLPVDPVVSGRKIVFTSNVRTPTVLHQVMK